MKRDTLGASTAVLAYGVAVGLVYTLTYWSRFGVDPLQFVGFVDLARLAIVPLLASGALVVVFNAAAFTVDASESRREASEGGGRSPAQARWLLRLVVLLAFLILALPSPFNALPAVFLAMVLGAAGVFLDVPFVVRVVPNVRLRYGAIIACLMLPALAYVMAHRSANTDARPRSHAMIVDMRSSGLSDLAADSDQPFTYLGRLGDTHFVFATAGRQLLMLHTSAVPRLVLQRSAEWVPAVDSGGSGTQTAQGSSEAAADPPGPPPPAGPLPSATPAASEPPRDGQ